MAICALLVAAPAMAGQEPEREPGPAGMGVSGQMGFFRSWAAETYPSGSLVVGTSLEYFWMSDFLVDGDENQRMASRFVLALVPYEGIELATGFSLTINRNSAFEPEHSQSVGDPHLSLRYGIELTDWFSLGGGVQAVFPTGSGSLSLSSEGISTRIMTTFAFRPLEGALIALNVGYHFDNSRFIFNHPIHEAQRFSAGINPHDQVLVELGLGWRFGPVAPFLEYGLAVAMGADELGFADNPSVLTLGARYWPFEKYGFYTMLGVDVGLMGVDAPEGAGRVPPYNLFAGLGYDFGTMPESEPKVEVREKVVEKIVEKRVEVPAPVKPMSRIKGVVLDANTDKPVPGAQIIIEGDAGPIYSSDAKDGQFVTCPAEPGPRKLTVSSEGYQTETQVVRVAEAAETPVTVKLQPVTGPTFGTLKGTIRAAGGGPLDRALIAIPTRKMKIRSSKTGAFSKKLHTGTFDVLISKPGYVTQRRKVKLSTGDVVILNVELYPKK
ncbi:MAG: carboxypeptidase regulatory-like domain-containing protein [Deltaproteobacteria bacterium]|nr:carboxypeptidase regulatory-like domain-containing protein [Deltaproteobacteria bacterium]